MAGACGLKRRQRGETLVGLLVGMALGLLVLAAGTQMLGQLLQGQRAALQDSHLQQDLHFALDLMVRELQNAQYVAQAWNTRQPGACRDAFCDEAADFQIGAQRIDFTADRNHNGLQENNECLGFKVADGVLSARNGCQSSGWQPLTDKGSVVVTGLQLQLHCTDVGGWLQRQLDLQLDARWPQDATRTWALRRTVALHNALPAVTRARYCP